MKKTFYLLIISVHLLFTGCKSNKSKINDFMDSFNAFPTLIDSSLESNSKPENHMEGNTRYSCYTKSGEERKSLEEFVTFNPTNGVLYPGSLIHGKTLNDGLLTNVNVKQGGGTLTINNIVLTDTVQKFKLKNLLHSIHTNSLNYAASDLEENKKFTGYDTLKYSKHIDIINEKSVRQAVAELLNKLPTKTQVARIFFTKEEVNSIEKDFLKAGISIKWMTGKFSADISRLKQSTYSKYLVKVVQPYYDISFKPDFNTSLHPSDFFAKNIKAEDLTSYYKSYDPNPGNTLNPPTYIQTITYGRMLMIIAESSEKQDVFNKAMEASFTSTYVSGSANLSQEQLSIINNSTFTVFSIGGSGDATVKILTAGKAGLADSLSQYLRLGANYSAKSPAYPISYVARYLKNDNIAKLGLSFKFAVPICTPNPRTVVGIKVRYYVTEDNKDDDESVSMTVIKNSVTRLVETPRYGYGEDWEENSPPRDFYIATPNLNEAELATTNVWIYKSPEHGGGSGYGGGMKFNLQLIAVLEDGASLDWRYVPNISMGNGQNNYQAF